MPNSVLPDSVRKLIQRFIVSVEQLDILLLLKKTPDKFWSVPEVLAKIQSSAPSVAERLRQLQSAGFLEKNDQSPPHYRYHPIETEMAATVDELQRAYKQSPVKVIEAIYSGSSEQARNFADSFKFRREE